MTYAPRSRTARATGSYANIGLETEVMGASPERLISLLFRGAQTALAQARHHLRNGNVAERGKALSKAIDIVESGLKASVDTERGGEVARHLIAAYELIIRDLMQANLHQDEAKLDSAEALLNNLAEAWQIAADPQFGLSATAP
ncbi:MAG: flagellar export chaperone FliS [Castellaniella sp.]|uniref:flagellar export chaperone FliS n=1 Tax=Castellaniella sp. TaxID=1955812 RepID=UPI0012176240|nr:flagellar export chaperone FliS [Castellaniella sp.]TAN27737.1 MAG: flagellar export chaperone FliS [Castellaniella sp.]